ncbi:hypothetical protein [Flavobacterium sp. N2038]|uniref:hypothetical protein n=1 Tax=Flavobacterium sp. N2038 TaxID=2986829 RepID=UPI0022249A64|nr:hypothetical protein [Flavobacterium sp. N2038]
MEKITLEKIENDYKEAIRNKFRIERSEGKHSHYLSNPSQALLRDLCWEIFTSNPKSDDLNVYRSFFRTDFTSEENTSEKYTNKFKKVGGFYRGEKDPANISTVELAAILVDFQPRPFNKFKKELAEEDLKLINELRNTNVPEKEASVTEVTEKKETVSFMDSIASFPEAESEPIEIEKIVLKPTQTGIQPIDDIIEEPKAKSGKSRFIAIAAGLFLLCIIVYFASSQKQCMQWSGDHYEKVDCDLKIEGLGTAARIEILDKSLVNLQKVNVCDTTTFFDKNGTAIIWYGKTANGIDFFNSHGRHPESSSSLKPVTRHILGKYVFGKGLKCK